MAISEASDNPSSSCFTRIPYGSMLALLICWVGVGMFCTMMYFAVNHSLNMAHIIFGIDPPWLDKVQLAFIIVGVVMAVAGLVLFILGILATGETRRSVYKGWTARLGGRISSALFLGFTYVLHLAWLLIFSGTVCLGFVFLVFLKLCPRDNRQECLDFHSFLPLFNATSIRIHDRPENRDWKLCGAQVQQFCSFTNEAWPQYLVGYIGCAMVLLSLVHFISCLAANYAHIKDEIKYIELNEIHNEYKLDERM